MEYCFKAFKGFAVKDDTLSGGGQKERFQVIQ
jgi:hypothetical protein